MDTMPRMTNDGRPIIVSQTCVAADTRENNTIGQPPIFSHAEPGIAPAAHSTSPTEPPDRGEPPFGTAWEYLDSQDAQDAYAEPNEDQRNIEYEDYREALADRYLRPDFVDWHRDRE